MVGVEKLRKLLSASPQTITVPLDYCLRRRRRRRRARIGMNAGAEEEEETREQRLVLMTRELLALEAW